MISSNIHLPILPNNSIFIQCNKAYVYGLISHHRLIHPHLFILKQVLYEIDKTSHQNLAHDICGSCKLGKSHILSFFKFMKGL